MKELSEFIKSLDESDHYGPGPSPYNNFKDFSPNSADDPHYNEMFDNTVNDVVRWYPDAFKQFVNNGHSFDGIATDEVYDFLNELIDYYASRGEIDWGADLYDDQSVSAVTQLLKTYATQDRSNTGNPELIDDRDAYGPLYKGNDAQHISLDLDGLEESKENKMKKEREYSNEPDEVYYDVDSVINRGNDLHRRKKTYKKVNGGDNPMSLEEKLRMLDEPVMETPDIDMSSYIDTDEFEEEMEWDSTMGLDCTVPRRHPRRRWDSSMDLDKPDMTLEQKLNKPRLKEGVSEIPDNPESVQKLKQVLKGPIPAKDASNIVGDIIFCDELFDDFYEVEKSDPNGDVHNLLCQRILDFANPSYLKHVSSKRANCLKAAGKICKDYLNKINKPVRSDENYKVKRRKISENNRKSRFIDEEPLTLKDLDDFDFTSVKRKPSFNVREAREIESTLWRKYKRF